MGRTREAIAGWLLGSEKLQELKASAAGPASISGGAGFARRMQTDYRGAAVEAFGENSPFHKAASDIMESVASVPLEAFRFTKRADGTPEKERASDHPLEALLSAPNPVQDRSDLLQELTLHRILAGEQFLEAVNVGQGSAKGELYALRPDKMDVIPGTDALPAAYVFRGVSRKHTFELDPVSHLGDVVLTKTANPLDQYRGLSPVVAGAFGIDTHNAANKWNLTSLQHGARPPAVLTIEGSTPQQRKEMRLELPDQMTGLDNNRGIMILDGKDAKLNMMSYSAVELDWLAGKFQSAREVCWALGYPSFLLGLPGDSTFNNQAEARLSLWEQTVLPWLNSLVSTVNNWLGPRYTSGDFRLVPNLDEVPALIGRREALFDSAVKGVEAGLLTPNEGRKRIGQPERDEEEANLLWIGSSRIPLTEADLPSESGDGEGEGDESAASGGAASGEAGAGDAVDKQVALTGIQTTTMLNIITDVLTGALPYDRGKAVLMAALAMSEAGAEAVLGPKSAAGSLELDEAKRAAHARAEAEHFGSAAAA